MNRSYPGPHPGLPGCWLIRSFLYSAVTLVVVLASSAVRADTATLGPARDTTLYQTSPETADAGNGSGDYLFSGVTKEGLARRALLLFDVASSIPAGAVIDSVELTLNVSKVPNPLNPADVALFRVTSLWGEGSSQAPGEEGQGQVPPDTGDSTWRHTFYDDTFWTSPGGDFLETPRATISIGDQGRYTWASTTGMVADVQSWLDQPASNFGWIVIADESDTKNSKRFDSREIVGDTRPSLVVNYHVDEPVGYCCTGEACVVVIEQQCDVLGGEFGGVGTSCSPNPCSDPAGACCAGNGTCSDTTRSACEAGEGIFQGEGSLCDTLMCPVNLTPWLDALPLPRVAVPASGAAGGSASYDIAIRETAQQLHSELPPSVVWAYDDGTGPSYPGPTIEAGSGLEVNVNWINDLRDVDTGDYRTEHILDVDQSCIHGAQNLPKVVVHLHGGHVSEENDGYPENTFLPGHQAGYVYPNQQQAGTLWYHDHALGITRLNVYMGLAGAYILRDETEQALELPAGTFEVPLVIQDRRFEAGGQLYYPAVWQDHFFGDKAVVNGKVWPYFDVTRGKYRFRLLNGSGSRVYTLSLAPDSGSLDFTVIGTEGGLLAAPVSGVSSLTMGPGERYDVIVDFEGFDIGSEILLENSAAAPFPGGSPSLPEILKFVVVDGAAHTAEIPDTLRALGTIDPAESVVARDFVLGKASDDGCGRQNWLINGLGWDDITEYPELGTVETWRFINDSGVSHPMHMHLVFFRILDRQSFTMGPEEEIIPQGDPEPPAAWEDGWKDTVMVHPGQMVRVIARFEDYAGKYAYHCHILEHEDHEMMRQFQTIVPNCEVTGEEQPVCDGIDNDCDGVVDEVCLIFKNGFE